MFKKWQHYAGRIIDRFVTPITPPAFHLALEYHKHTKLLKWEPEVLQIKSFAHRSDMAIDVGANMGLWTYAMVKSGLFNKVIAFEPNPCLTKNLSSVGFSSVTVINKAVSSEPGTSHLKIPKQGNVLLTGWASLEKQLDLHADEFQEMAVETIRLDDLELNGVGFIKIDVEGHELSALRGARNLLIANRPICLIECRERSKHEVEEFFLNLNVGYMRVDTEARFGFVLSPGNFMFAAR